MLDAGPTPETWKPVPGYEGLYEVSDFGRVRSLDRRVRCAHGGTRFVRGQVLRPGTMNEYGHVSVMLGRGGGSRCVHDLVLSAFVGPRPEGFEARHLDTNGFDNRLPNLAWGTKSQNGKDVTRAGKRKFTYEQVDKIRAERESGVLLRELAAKWGCSVAHMSYVTGSRYYVR